MRRRPLPPDGYYARRDGFPQQRDPRDDEYDRELLYWLADVVELLLEERGVANEGEP